MKMISKKYWIMNSLVSMSLSNYFPNVFLFYKFKFINVNQIFWSLLKLLWWFPLCIVQMLELTHVSLFIYIYLSKEFNMSIPLSIYIRAKRATSIINQLI